MNALERLTWETLATIEREAPRLFARIEGAISSLPAPRLDAALAVQAAGGACLVALLLIGVLRMRRRRDPNLRASWVQARHMAQRGVSRLEIARATGLSQDAIALLLHADPTAAKARRNLPEAERIAVRKRSSLALPLRRKIA